jgi:uncharacterized protein YbbC (DUF1343 family)
MRLNFLKNTLLLFVILLINSLNKNPNTKKIIQKPVVGANQMDQYLPLIFGKNVGVIANQTSVVFLEEINTNKKVDHVKKHIHLVDTLIKRGVKVKKVFGPEHGFRGTADAGEYVNDGVDINSGIPIVSLYGKNRKPSYEMLKDIEVILFDVQDVGTRFYTFTSTLHYVMEACAKLNIPVIILDRPNPNGHYVDGPVLKKEYQSFVGMHPVPIVHGMTIGEYALMINGENWLEKERKCNLKVIPLKHYNRMTPYKLPIKPSPNLPNTKAINLYPSLCLFEGTNVSVGRGTEKQFQIYGSPLLDQKKFNYNFTPQPNFGAKSPKHQNKLCFGENLSQQQMTSKIELKWLIKAYQNSREKDVFFNTFFTKLAGQEVLQKQIENECSAKEIIASWQSDLEVFKTIRTNYLLYP